MNRLSVNTPPLVNTLAIDAINPKANNRTDRLDASSKMYNIAVSNFSIEVNCFMTYFLSGVSIEKQTCAG